MVTTAAETETNKALIRRFFEEAFNRGDPGAVEAVWIAGQTEAGKRGVTNLRTAFPDYHRTVEGQLAEGDLVATRWTARGTRRRPYRSRALGRTLEPTGRRVEVPGISIHRIADGRIVEAWVMSNDSVELLLQLGAMPVGDQAPLR